MKLRGLVTAMAALGAMAAPGWAGNPRVAPQEGPHGTIVGIVKTSEPQHTVVYLTGVEGEFKPPEAPVAMDHKSKTFIPHILPVLKGTTVRFVNSDFNPDGSGMEHNVKFVKFGGSKTLVMREKRKNLTNFMVWPDRPKDAKTIRPGKVALLCNIHTEMEAYVVVLDNPYFTVAGEDGRFRLEVPEGAYTVKAWHPRYAKKEFEAPVVVKRDKDTEVSLELKK